MSPDINMLAATPPPMDEYDYAEFIPVLKPVAKPNKDREYEIQRLVQRCGGRTVHVPNLMSLMPAWPKNIQSKEVLDEVNEEIDEWLKRYVTCSLHIKQTLTPRPGSQRQRVRD
jgi:ABC-type uncharacterized transport system involved in gliding motility auxiliary subunit